MSTCKITRVSICVIRVRSESLADSIPLSKKGGRAEVDSFDLTRLDDQEPINMLPPF